VQLVILLKVDDKESVDVSFTVEIKIFRLEAGQVVHLSGPSFHHRYSSLSPLAEFRSLQIPKAPFLAAQDMPPHLPNTYNEPFTVPAADLHDLVQFIKPWVERSILKKRQREEEAGDAAEARKKAKEGSGSDGSNPGTPLSTLRADLDDNDYKQEEGLKASG
jgi:hypothetical protein